MLVAQLSMTDKHWLTLRANLALACIAVVTVGAVASMLKHGPRSNLAMTPSASRSQDVASAHPVRLTL
ncbi:MAG TPA: hypothetical protein VII50_06850 [Acidothermaceae bacterium]